MLSSEPTPFFVVKVSDPIKMSAGTFNTYVEYKVTTSSNLPDFKSTEVTVTRRFSDFSWLSEQLVVEFPGVVIPALPDKQISLGGFTKLSFSTDVDARARALEKFLQRVGAHPQLAYSKRFFHFLQIEDSGSFAAAKIEAKGCDEKKGNPMAGVIGMLGNLAKQTTGHKAELERTAADDKFEEIAAYLTTLEGHLDKVSKAATTMVRRNRQASEELFEFSQGVAGLGVCEADSLGDALTQTGSSLDQLSQAATKYVNGELVQLDEPLQEYVRLLRSLKAALKRREDRKTAYALAVSDLESKHAALSKAAGAPNEDAKQAAVDKAQTHCDTCKASYEKVSAELQDEFECFKAQKTSDLKQILINWVKLQVDYCKRSEETWSNLVPTLNTITIGGYMEGDSAAEELNYDSKANSAAYSSGKRGYTSFGGGAAAPVAEEDKFTTYDHDNDYGYSASPPAAAARKGSSDAPVGFEHRSSVPSMAPPPPPPPSAPSNVPEEVDDDEDCAGV